ncbi:MAG: phosphoenolpyruvate carboxykinase (GTP), partial [Thermoplasmata archaeon]
NCLPYAMFRSVFGKEYRNEQYEEQFKIRVSRLIEKDERIREIYEGIPTTPSKVKEEISAEIDRLRKLQSSHGDEVSPTALR